MSDAVGTSTFTYTPGNELLTDSSPWSSTTLTNFYSNRLRTGLSLQAGRTVWTNGFTYDAAARMNNVLSPAGTFVYSYAFAGPQVVSKISLPNTSYVTNTFDSVTRMTGTFLKNSANTVLDSATYGYNAANQRTTYTNAAGTYVNYGYDNIGQLLVANSSVSTENRGYYYDAAWNLNRRTNNGTPTTFSVDVQNQLTSGPASAYTYDANGNIVSTSLGVSYSYDDENRLTTIISTNNYRTIMTYDGLGRMRTREDDTWNGASWTPGTANKYQYDGTVVISGGGTGGFYTRGIDLSGALQGAGGIGGLLAATFGFGGVGVAHYYYHSDANGNVTYLVDKNQAMAANYRYDPYGNTISSGGSEVGANLFRFSSKEQFSYSGLYVYLYRLYDPTLQRWLNRDPMSEVGGLNLYTFADNEPLDFIDPFGLGVQPPSGPPPVLIPGFPDGRWIPGGSSGDRPKWVPNGNVPGRSPPSASWDPLGHWDVDDGLGHRLRYDFRGKPISAQNAHANPHRKPKKGPGSLCGILFGISAGGASGLGATANNGDFAAIAAAAKNGASPDEIDEMVYDAAVDAAIETGNAGALPGLYGPFHWMNSGSKK